MSKVLALLVVVCVVVVTLAAPARPVISSVFHADVSVSLLDGTKAYRGGGVYAVDTKNNRARTDFKLEDESAHEHYLFLHILDRYDLHARYIINDLKCEKQAVKGDLENPWDWVQKATYVGSNVFRGQSYDEWSYQEANSTTRLAVLTSDTTKPVFLNTHDVDQGVVTQFNTVFEEFDTTEPELWVFYVPQICENATRSTDKAGGDVNAVVYFANNNWNCANVACSSRVPAGTGQPGYECAEFAARALAAGSFIPGLSSTSAQSSYSSYKGNNLCLVTGLYKALGTLGFHAAGSVEAASALFGDGGDGAWSHACIGIGASVADCHNNARQGISASGVMFKGINAISAP